MATTAQQQPTGPAAGASEGDVSVQIDTQHQDTVHDAQFDYYGCHLATCSSDRTVAIFDVSGDSYTQTATLRGHEGPIWEVSWSHPKFGVILASCSFDGSVLIHRETRPREWTLLHAARNLHESSVNSVTFAPHEFGLILAAASSDGRVSILTHEDDNSWSVEYIPSSTLGVNAVAWAPYVPIPEQADPASNEAIAAVSPPMRIVTAGCDNRIHFWIKHTSFSNSEEEQQGWIEDPDSPVLTTTLSHTDWVRDVAWAPPISPNLSIVASCSEDRTVLIWTQTGGPSSPYTPTLLNQFDDPVWRVSWSLTGSVLAVSSGDNTVTLWKAGLDGTWRQVQHVPDTNNNTNHPVPVPGEPQ